MKQSLIMSMSSLATLLVSQAITTIPVVDANTNGARSSAIRTAQFSSKDGLLKMVPKGRRTTIITTMSTLQSFRGGGEIEDSMTTMKKKRKKKKSSSSSSSSGGGTQKKRTKKKAVEIHDEEDEEEGKVINEAMKEKDAADALGDAIRDRAHILRKDIYPLDTTLTSIGLALGNTDYNSYSKNQREDATIHAKHAIDSQDDIALQKLKQQQQFETGGGGGVQASPAAVLANYFLHSHGGSHGIQCFMSLCSILFGITSLFLTSQNNTHLKLLLVQRSLLCALTKHVGGIFFASIQSAQSIQQIGYRKIRDKLQVLALDPISQYSFYCALMMIWIPKTPPKNGVVWWIKKEKNIMTSVLTACILGPILLREVISTIWVISDVIVLLHSTTTSPSKVTTVLLKTCTSIINTMMNLLFTPSKWSNATTPSTKQFLLANLISKISILLECITCVIVCIDALRGLVVEYILKESKERTVSITNVLKRLICAKLYINWIMVRKKKIMKVEQET